MGMIGIPRKPPFALNTYLLSYMIAEGHSQTTTDLQTIQLGLRVRSRRRIVIILLIEAMIGYLGVRQTLVIYFRITSVTL